MKFELILKADTYQEFRDMIQESARGVIEGETKVMKLGEPPDLPDRKEKQAAVQKGYVKDPGIKEAPPLGSEKKKGKIDKDLVKVLLGQGWTQSKIAKEMGVTQSAVYQIVKRYKLDEKDI